VVLTVVLGSAQGFCLAFGADIEDFRNPFQAIISVALYTVGKFNYDELVWSQRWFGPMLFWVYIFLVFFVMMSVFIAILSEGYEAAKEVIPATASGNIWEALQTVAVTNYRDSKQKASLSFRKVTGRNKVHDRWAAAGSRIRVGVKLQSAMAESAVPEEDGKKRKKRAYTTKDANIATDSESDGEEHHADVAHRISLRSILSEPSTAARPGHLGRGTANLWMENSNESDVRRKASSPEPDRHESDDEEEQEEDKEREEEERNEDEDRAEDGVVVPEALERLEAVEDQVAMLATQHASASKKMRQLTEKMQQMGHEQAATLTNILESLESIAATPAQPAQEKASTGRSSPSGSSGHNHHRSHGRHHKHRHHSPASTGDAADNHDQAGRTASPTDTSSRISPVRTKVPSMREQMAAAVSAASATSSLQKRTKKIPSLREQMAASAERSQSPAPQKKKMLSMREQMAASAERARSQFPISSARAQPGKPEVMSMREQMAAAAAAEAVSVGSTAAAPAPAPPQKVVGMRAQMEAMAALQQAADHN
jgi:hypothetical protein